MAILRSSQGKKEEVGWLNRKRNEARNTDSVMDDYFPVDNLRRTYRSLSLEGSIKYPMVFRRPWHASLEGAGSEGPDSNA